MEPRIIDANPRQFGPSVAVGSMEFMRFLMDVDATLSDGVTSWRREGIERHPGSEIEGRGLFTNIDLEPHELIAVKSGRVVNEASVRQLTADGVLHGSQQQIGLNLFLIGLTEAEEDKNLVGYNHSCSPNAFFVWNQSRRDTFGTALLMSRQAIAAGQEITADYSVSHISNTHRFVCNCQSPDCRVLIQPRYDYLDPEFQEKYKGQFPDYVQELIDDLQTKPQEERDAILFSARFGEIVGRIAMLDGAITELEARPNQDDFTKQRTVKFTQLLTMNAAFLASHFPGVAENCGINMSNARSFQKSLTKRQAAVVAFAKNADDAVGWQA
jgi:hypothetical protein